MSKKLFGHSSSSLAAPGIFVTPGREAGCLPKSAAGRHPQCHSADPARAAAHVLPRRFRRLPSFTVSYWHSDEGSWSRAAPKSRDQPNDIPEPHRRHEVNRPVSAPPNNPPPPPPPLPLLHPGPPPSCPRPPPIHPQTTMPTPTLDPPKPTDHTPPPSRTPHQPPNLPPPSYRTRLPLDARVEHGKRDVPNWPAAAPPEDSASAGSCPALS